MAIRAPYHAPCVIDVIGNEMIGNLNHFAYHLKWFIAQKKPLILSMIVIVSGKNDLGIMMEVAILLSVLDGPGRRVG